MYEWIPYPNLVFWKILTPLVSDITNYNLCLSYLRSAQSTQRKVTRCAHYPRSYWDFLIDFSPELSNVTGFFFFSPEKCLVSLVNSLFKYKSRHDCIYNTSQCLFYCDSLFWSLLNEITDGPDSGCSGLCRHYTAPLPHRLDCQTCSELAF